jgi:hypothetical protein
MNKNGNSRTALPGALLSRGLAPRKQNCFAQINALELPEMLRSGRVSKQRFLPSNNDFIPWIDAPAPRTPQRGACRAQAFADLVFPIASRRWTV